MLQRSSRSERPHGPQRAAAHAAPAGVPDTSRAPPALPSLLLAALLGSPLLGCGLGGPASFPAASELPDDRRRPDGVAIDLASAPPRPANQADVRDRVVTLRTPLGVGVALDVVAEFFKRIIAEDSEALGELLTRDALAIHTGSGGSGQPPSAGLFWEQRFRRLEYGKLAGEPVYRESELQIFRAEDVLATPQHPAIQPETLDDQDIVIRVPIMTARIAADRLLGDEIVVWLRRDGPRFKIYRLLEDFQLQ
ncbi:MULTISPECIES: hypothetical protein [Sorangium]|uniref:Uncharacterized protein n=1 Tax=Sorangium cellulosum TaxID=56 RepID=A0A4P2R0A1_SORCE|nr:MULTISPECIES: hypothetical protein [Sorangium]AUX35303.1 hypothetical protein SOCE836_074940 [Sorangium cellulosum]WCQ94607.1 hypothetical protein NQZ70_07375 [Sorangium sp. Soce836]